MIKINFPFLCIILITPWLSISSANSKIETTRPAAKILGAPKLIKSPGHCHGIRGIETHQKVVALTFDDGPHEIYTKKILEVLGEHSIKATFFMAGENVLEYPELVILVHLRGHIIANHTQFHKKLSLLSKEEIEQEIMRCGDAIFSILGEYPLLFRPPYGACSKTSAEVADTLGLQTITWNATANDFHAVLTTPQKIAQEVLALTKPGAIILLHDAGGNRHKTVEALKIIIKTLKKDGYKFLTVAELLGIDPYLQLK